MKLRTTLYIVIISALLGASCSVTGFSNPLEVANEAAKAQPMLTMMNASYILSEDTETSISRTVSPGSSSGYTDGNDNEITTPAAEYADLGGSGTVSSTIYDDFYGPGSKTKGSFTLAPASNNRYKIVVTVYPYSNFEVASQVETYYVNNTDGTWAPYETATSSDPWNFESITVNYNDGTTAQQTILANTSTTPAVQYQMVAVPSNVLENLSSYSADQVTAPATDAGAEYSVHSTTYGEAGLIDIEEWYTEFNTDADSLVDIISSLSIRNGNSTDSNEMQYVTRFQQNLDSGIYTFRSLGNKSGGQGANTFVEERDVETDGNGRLVYTAKEKSWYKSAVDVDPASDPNRLQFLSLTETAQGSGEYSGTMETYWGNRGERYSVEVGLNSDGSTTLTTTYLERIRSNSITSRSSNAVHINVNDPTSIRFSIPGSPGEFQGKFEQGRFVGSYIYYDRSAAVEISEQGVEVDGTFYPNEELDPVF